MEMRHRSALRSIAHILLGFLLLAVGAVSLYRSMGVSEKVLVLVTISGLREDAIGPSKTPEIWEMTEGGERIGTHLTSVPAAVPALVSLMTGTPAEELASVHAATTRIGLNEQILATRLSEAGFRASAMVGEGEVSRLSGICRGFDVCSLASSPFDQAILPDEVARVQIRRAGFLRAEDIASSVVLFLRALHPGSSSFVWLHFADPAHALRKQGDKEAYQAAVAEVDRAIGRLNGALHTSGLSGSAVLAVVSLHGEAMGDAGEARHGLTMTDSVVELPYFITGGHELPVPEAIVGIDQIHQMLLERVGLAGEQSDEAVAAFARSGIPSRYYGWNPAIRAEFESGTLAIVDDVVWTPRDSPEIRGEGAWEAIPRSAREIIARRMPDLKPEVIGVVDRAAIFALMASGHELLLADEMEQGLRVLEEVSELAPDAITPWEIGVGRIMQVPERKRAQYKAFLERADRFVARQSSNANVLRTLDLARILMRMEKEEDARRLLLKLPVDGLSLGESLAIAEAFVLSGAIEEAVRRLEKISETEGYPADLEEWIGDLHQRAGNAFRARVAYERALETPYARSSSLIAKLGDALAGLGDYESALQRYAEAVREDPTYRYPHMRAADALIALDRPGAAAHAVVQGVLGTGNPVEDAILRARTLASKGLVPAAVEELHSMISKVSGPGRARLRLSLARLLFDVGAIEGAREAAVEMAEGGRPSAAAMILLSKIAAVNASEKEAIEWLDKAEEVAGPEQSRLVRAEPLFREFGTDSELAKRAANFSGRGSAKTNRSKKPQEVQQ